MTATRHNFTIKTDHFSRCDGTSRAVTEMHSHGNATVADLPAGRPAAEERAAVTRSQPAPSVGALARVISTILSDSGFGPGEVAILGRQPNIHEGTFHSEIVTCRFPDGKERQLLCKHSAGCDHNCFGHRGGMQYEAAVYRRILSGLPLPTPAFYGDHFEAGTKESWLILEFLEKAVRVDRAIEPDAMTLAARWIAQFHANWEHGLSRTPMYFLNRYDAQYYSGWSNRTWLFAAPLHNRYPWLANACRQYAEAIDWLLAQPLTLIHGEYYPFNVLFDEGSVYPVDWESAAIAVGEIDLASITDRWPEEYIHEMELEYQRARWPSGVPAEFERTLAAARLYLNFRWLGDRHEWTTSGEYGWRFEQLRLASERWASIKAD